MFRSGDFSGWHVDTNGAQTLATDQDQIRRNARFALREVVEAFANELVSR